MSHNPYFSRWFSAISKANEIVNEVDCHNPYFSRWFSAIKAQLKYYPYIKVSQSLF